MEDPKRIDPAKRFEQLTPKQAAAFYKNRPLDKLPNDLLEACNRMRVMQRDVTTLRAQLFRSRLKNIALAAVLGGAAAKGVEVAVIALIKAFSH